MDKRTKVKLDRAIFSYFHYSDFFEKCKTLNIKPPPYTNGMEVKMIYDIYQFLEFHKDIDITDTTYKNMSNLPEAIDRMIRFFLHLEDYDKCDFLTKYKKENFSDI